MNHETHERKMKTMQRVQFALFSCVSWLLLVVGCSPKAEVSVDDAPARPHVEVTARAQQALRLLAASQGLGQKWWVRLSLVWRDPPDIEVHIDREPPGPNDFEFDGGGIRCVMANELKVYLKGAQVDWFEVQEGGGFDVTFDNQDDRDREASGAWYRAELARRRGNKAQ
jgi:Fe-S cluster assembly iron-binding protein IscA